MLACLLSLAVSGLLLAGGCRDTLDPFDRLQAGPGARLVVTDTLFAEADSYIRQTHPNANWGADTALQLGGGGKSRVLVRFDSTALRTAVGAGTLDSAWLEFTIAAGPQGWGSNERTVDLHRLLKDWTELGATWNCAVDANLSNSVPDCPTQGWDMTNNGNGTYHPAKTDRVTVNNGQTGVIRLNVTADVQGYLGGTLVSRGWVFRKTSESQGGEAIVFSRESGSQPRLVLRVTTQQVPAIAPDSVPSWVYADSNISSGSPLFHGSFVKQIVVVLFRRTATQQQRQAAVDLVNGTVVGGNSGLVSNGSYFIRVSDPGDGSALLAAVDALKPLPYVLSATLEVFLSPNYLTARDGAGWDTWELTPGLANGQNWALELLSAPFAWGCSVGDSATAIGVVDTYFQNFPEYTRNVSLRHGTYVAPDPSPLHSHGTFVTSLLAARGNNDSLMSGLMWRADVRVYDYGSGSPGNPLGRDPLQDAVVLIRKAVEDGALIVNMSNGLQGWLVEPSQSDTADVRRVTAYADALAGAIEDLRDQGLEPLVILSAGNEGPRDAYWGGLPAAKNSQNTHQILVVGGGELVGSTLQWWDSSQTGSLVDVVAPAAGVFSLNGLEQVVSQSGTSFAAPLVTGIAGLLHSFDNRLGADSLKALILGGAVRSGVSAGGIPVANAYESLKLAAERAGAPLCGNRVFVQGDSVFVQRGSAGPDEKILTMPGAGGGGWVLTHHGGHFLQAVVPYQWTSGGWIPSDTLPQDPAQGLTGSSLSRAWAPGNSPVSHDFDSTAWEVETSTSPRTFDLRLALLSDPSQSRLVTSFPGLWNNDAIAIPPVGPELVVGVMRDDGAYTNWDVYAVHQGTGAQRFLFSRSGSVFLSPGFSEDGAELSLSRYLSNSQCVTEFVSPVTGAPLRAPVSYPAGYPYCHGPAAWGASRRPVASSRRP